MSFLLAIGIVLCCAWSGSAQDVEIEPLIEARATCNIAINGGLPEPQPLLIIPYTNRFLEPQGRDGVIYMQTGEQVELYCSGSFVSPFPNTKTLYATCSAGTQFIVNGALYNFAQLACTGQVATTAQRTTHRCGHGWETVSEIGFQVDNRFLSIMDVCHDEYIESSLYSHFIQSPFNAGYQTGFPRPSFITGNFFNGKNVDNLYTQVSQQATIGRILGEAMIPIYWPGGDIYLARGHLAAKVDYIYGSQQRGTFYFINAAPQWQSFNAYNWERIENSVRLFVADRNIHAEIYTGTWNVLELRDVNSVYRPLYLYLDQNNNGLIPVPALYYKVVIDVNTRRGIVFIGVNNPHATAAEIASSRYTICSDVSGYVNWINWDRTNIVRGYSYACDVNDFVRTVNHLPVQVQTTGLLY